MRDDTKGNNNNLTAEEYAAMIANQAAPALPLESQVLNATIPGSEDFFLFNPAEISSEEGGFLPFKTLREELVECLITCSSEEDRAFLSEEIFEAFESGRVPVCASWNEQYKDYEAAKKAYNLYTNAVLKMVSKGKDASPSHAPERAPRLEHSYISLEARKGKEVRKAEVTRMKNSLYELCKQETVFNDYVKAYDAKSNSKPLSLGYKSAILYARKKKNISVYVWKPSSRALCLDLVNRQVSDQPEADVVHMLLESESKNPVFLAPLFEHEENAESNELENWLSNQEEIVKEQVFNFLQGALSDVKEGEHENRIKRESFFWLLDTLTLPGNPHFLKKATAIYSQYLEKCSELDRLALEKYQTELMIEAIVGDPKKDQTFAGIRHYYEAIYKDRVKRNAFSEVDFDELMKKIDKKMQDGTLLNEVKKNYFDRLVMRGAFGNKLTLNGAHYLAINEKRSGASILLKEDHRRPYSKESILFCGGEREFEFVQELETYPVKWTTGLPGSRQHIADFLKTKLTKNKDCRDLAKGIFQDVVYARNEGSSTNWLTDPGILAMADMLIQVENILSLPDLKVKPALMAWSKDKSTIDWVGRHSVSFKASKNDKLPKFIENIPHLKCVDNLARIVLKNIREYCLEQGEELCLAEPVRNEYLDSYAKNADLWLCGIAQEKYRKFISKKNIFSKNPDWFEEREISIEEIKEGVASILADESKLERVSNKDMIQMAKSFMDDPSPSLNRDILNFFGLGNGKPVQEFSVMDISSDKDKPDFPKIGRLKLQSKARVALKKKSSFNVVFYEGNYKKLLVIKDYFKPFADALFEQATDQLYNRLVSALTLPAGEKLLKFNYDSHIKSQLSRVEKELIVLSASQNQEREKIKEERRVLSEGLGDSSLLKELKEVRMKNLDYMPLSIREHLRAHLLRSLCQSFSGNSNVNVSQMVTARALYHQINSPVNAI
jgi:hypothetical protein